MVFVKFSILFLFSLHAVAQVAAPGQTRFDSRSCLSANYVMKMVQKGPLFGLIKQEFVIDKNNCLIKISHKKYFPKEWKVDICREPVHIKVMSATGVDVAKKEADCIKKDKSKDTSDFCSQYFNILDVIQDDGLIFAEGDRDNLTSDHGKTYCSYLLLKKYLNESVIFSQYTEVPDIFLEMPKEEPKAVPLIEDKTETESKSKPEEVSAIQLKNQEVI